MQQSIEQRNDLNNLRRIYDLFDVIKNKHTFKTKEGIKSKLQLDEVIEHFIKPYLVETGKNIKDGKPDSDKPNQDTDNPGAL